MKVTEETLKAWLWFCIGGLATILLASLVVWWNDTGNTL